MKRPLQLCLWLVAIFITAGAVFAGMGVWKAKSVKRAPAEIFQAYFEGAPESVKSLSAADVVWKESSVQISFTSETRVRLLEELRYRETACTDQMLLAFALKADPTNQRCFKMEDSTNDDTSFLIHDLATGQHFFHAAE